MNQISRNDANDENWNIRNIISIFQALVIEILRIEILQVGILRMGNQNSKKDYTEN